MFSRLILSKKSWFPTKTTYHLSISDAKCCCILGILEKHAQFVTFFVYMIHQIPTIIGFKLGAWCTVKTCAYLLCFSTLKGSTELRVNSKYTLSGKFGTQWPHLTITCYIIQPLSNYNVLINFTIWILTWILKGFSLPKIKWFVWSRWHPFINQPKCYSDN